MYWQISNALYVPKHIDSMPVEMEIINSFFLLYIRYKYNETIDIAEVNIKSGIYKTYKNKISYVPSFS